MAAFYNETPTGVTDGVNKIFTVTNSIGFILGIVFDGVPYSGSILLSGAIITIGDAPTTSIVVSYTDVPTAVLSTSGSTVEQILVHLNEAIGTGVATRFTDQKKVLAIEYARTELLVIVKPEEVLKEVLITFANAIAALPTDYLLHEKLFTKGATGFQKIKYKKVKTGSYDRYAPLQWTIRDDGTGRKIHITDTALVSAYLRYIPSLTALSSTTDFIGLPFPYDYALGYMAAGKILKDDGQLDRGIDRYTEGVRLAHNAFADDTKEQEDNLRLKSPFEDDENIMGSSNTGYRQAYFTG